MIDLNMEKVKEISRQYEYSVRSAETDAHDEIHLFNLLSMVQEAASIDAEICNLGATQLDPMGYCWMLLRTSVRLYKIPKWKDCILLDTWTNGVERLFSIREFAITDKNSQIIGVATTSWLVVDKNSHKPQKISMFTEKRLTEKTISALGFSSPKLEHWYNELTHTPAMIKDAGYSEIDRNNHVNNTRYAAWCLDAIGNKFDISSAQLIGIDINYMSEVFFGEKIELFCAKITSEFSYCSDAACVTAVVGRHVEEGKTAFVALFYWDDLL